MAHSGRQAGATIAQGPLRREPGSADDDAKIAKIRAHRARL
jgi:hypothetical protein